MRHLLLGIFTLCFSISSQAQLSGNLEVNANQLNQPSLLSVGASLQYLVYENMHFLPGVNVGIMYEYNRETTDQAINVPIQIQARYYLVGVHGCCGGGYSEINAGGMIKQPLGNQSEIKKVVPIASLGIGYRFPMSYDYNFRIGTMLVNGRIEHFVGAKIGYTF